MNEDLSNEWNCREYKDRWITNKERMVKHMAFFFAYFGVLVLFSVFARMPYLFFFSLVMMICSMISEGVYAIQLSMYSNTHAIIKKMEVMHGKIDKCARRRKA